MKVGAYGPILVQIENRRGCELVRGRNLFVDHREPEQKLKCKYQSDFDSSYLQRTNLENPDLS